MLPALNTFWESVAAENIVLRLSLIFLLPPFFSPNLFSSSLFFFFKFVCNKKILIYRHYHYFGASLVAQMVKNLPAMWETQVWSLDWEDPQEKGMVIHSSILAWRIPWAEEPGVLWSVGSQRVGHDWATNTSISLSSLFYLILTVILWRRYNSYSCCPYEETGAPRHQLTYPHHVVEGEAGRLNKGVEDEIR